MGAALGGASTFGLSRGVIGELENPSMRGSRTGFVRGGMVSNRGGSGLSVDGREGGSREVGVLAPKPRERASFVGVDPSVTVRTGVGTLFSSRGG